MSRTDYLTLAIVAVCVAALAFLIYKFVNMPSDGPAEDQIEQTLTPETDAESYEMDTTAFTTSEFGDEKPAGESAADTDDLDDKKVTAVDEYPASTTKPAEKPSTTKAPASTPSAFDAPSAGTTSSAGAYLVMAGSFKERANAESMVAKLRKMGYDGASVEIFDRGAYAVALVDRFDTYGEANTLVKALAGKGVEATIHKKR